MYILHIVALKYIYKKLSSSLPSNSVLLRIYSFTISLHTDPLLTQQCTLIISTPLYFPVHQNLPPNNPSPIFMFFACLFVATAVTYGYFHRHD